ncbi:hypothetical protein GYM68_09165 [Lactobacillus panisapium]|uniref:hypothetical protein n=1 Tax=Lactobacillus panisapium TaxID=2012495 RepID=UPI001C69B1FF|nr:hypothetical protein [Lactobacillus panisapium]QYN59394.1 hypothetical protein GYM68_09165 [Lactobacillus panisapium]
MQIIQKFIELIADFIANILNFMITHVLLSAMTIFCWLYVIGFIAYKAEHTQLFGLWWQLDNKLNHFANTCFAMIPIILILLLLYLAKLRMSY